MRTDAILIVPPFLKVVAGPLLGPAMLAAAGRAAGHRVRLLDLNARWLGERLPASELGVASAFVGDHDRPSAALRLAQREYALVCRTALGRRSAPELPEEEPSLSLTVGHDDVLGAAETLARTNLGRWLRMHLLSPPEPHVVGLSVMYSGQVLAALVVSAIARDVWPRATVVWGGAHVTALRDAIVSDPIYGALVDRFVFGYAERTWVEILDAAGGLRPLPRAAAVAGSGVSDTALDDPQVVPRFDQLRDHGWPRLTLPAQTSRGCAYGRCSFCTYPAVEGRYRELDLEPALAVVEQADRMGAAVSFKDSLIVPARLTAVAERVAGRVAWSACTKLHRSYEASFLRRLAAGGCATLEFGLETLTPSGQLLISKKQTLPLFLRVLDAAGEAGIAVVINYITGFPGTPAAEEQRWLDRVRKALADRPGLVGKVEHNVFQLERMSPMGRSPVSYGLRVMRTWPWASVMAWESVEAAAVVEHGAAHEASPAA